MTQAEAQHGRHAEQVWRQIEPGVWELIEEIDEDEATNLMRERLERSTSHQGPQQRR